MAGMGSAIADLNDYKWGVENAALAHSRNRNGRTAVITGSDYLRRPARRLACLVAIERALSLITTT